MKDFALSTALWQKACRLIPGGTHTYSKRVTTLLDAGKFPAYAVRAEGAHLYDLDGRCYVDYIAALAPILLGYAHPRVQARIQAQLKDGGLFSLPHPMEVELAELLTRVVPCCEMVRLFKTGAEATSAAVRCARLATGREAIVQCGYHGWHDWWAVTLSRAGIPKATADLTVNFAFNDFDSFRSVLAQHGDRAAAIVLTPAAYGVEPAPGFLECVRAEASRRGIVLVFDEIITGFRWSLGGAQGKYGVKPDLACVGKSMANGMPLGALVGARTLMAPLKDNWMSSTFASDALAIAASLETIAILRDEPVYPKLYDVAKRLNAGIGQLAAAAGIPIAVGAAVPAIHFSFLAEPAERATWIDTFVGSCAEHGVLVRRDATGVSLCLIAALTDEDIERTMQAMNSAFHEVARLANEKKTGPKGAVMPQPAAR